MQNSIYFRRATESNDTAAVLVRWVLSLGRLREYRLAVRRENDEEDEEDQDRVDGTDEEEAEGSRPFRTVLEERTRTKGGDSPLHRPTLHLGWEPNVIVRSSVRGPYP
jgi:hypothetical protein